ncbi:YggT family protein [Nocardia blacklockiae]|uniref:YggT family protein n=1 Tax=Nocardia blacklockiae TaxID=480036 RepID=UPI0018960B92|nr:YggT family protein [Nocardia blacklockiae]MBF6170248.1 YggT family protein [Nocardia blacklockiae]
MSLVGAVLGYLLTVFLLLLIARLIVDWAEMLANRPSWLWKVRRFTHAATEPVIAPVRRVLKPVRLGGVALDLAFTVVFLAVLILRSVAFSL